MNFIKKKKEFFDLSYIRTKQIVGATLNGCAKYINILQKVKFKTLFIEEAGEVLESHIVSILQKGIDHIVLIGDHQQLKPKLSCYNLEQKYRANTSLFERLINDGIELVTLSYQRRMKTKFADFIRLIYKDYKDHISIQALNHQQVIGINEDLLFFDHSKLEEQNEANQSKSNSFEAQMIVNFSQYLISKGNSESAITILTTYSKQAKIIKNSISKNIKVSTIDDYQGEENNIIILSLVRSNNSCQLGFVAIDNRICVAFSRAKIGFYVFGNFTFIQNSIELYLQQSEIVKKAGISDLWLKIIELANQKKVITDHFTFTCERHDEQFNIYDVQDWENFKDGCKWLCLEQFPCGHQCKKKCSEGEHEHQDCTQIVEETLSCGHFGRRQCGRQSFDCDVLVDKLCDKCNKKMQVKCSWYIQNTQCFQKCEQKLQCGHDCEGMCYQDCKDVKCTKIVKIQLECNHCMGVKCEDKNISKLICIEKCKKPLMCVHSGTCSRNCGSCLKDLTCICLDKCEGILDCGHICEKLCYEKCIGCSKICNYFFNCKINCQQQCYQRCQLCQNKCQIQCVHQTCSKMCYEICDRQPCNERCELQLQCGCQCMGLCGEECPKICMEMKHKNEFSEVDATYYQIECQNKCIYLVNELDSYMKTQFDSLIKCQRCDSIIWASQRYECIIKQSIQKFNEWKVENLSILEIDDNKLDVLYDLVRKKLEYVKKNSLKDHNNFLENIRIKVKRNLYLLLNQNQLEINFQNVLCIQKQLEFYEQSRTLEILEIQNSDFDQQAFVLGQEYLLNTEFQSHYSEGLWRQIELKLKTLFLYYDIDLYLQKYKNIRLEQILDEIENSNFLLQEEEIKKIEEKIYS